MKAILASPAAHISGKASGTMGRKLQRSALAVAFAVSVAPLVMAEPASAVTMAQGTFVQPYVRSGFSCPSTQVMLGIHVNKQKVICAVLNYGYRIQNRYTDYARGTQVSSNPSMHGCAQNYVIQAVSGISPFSTAKDEDLTCVSLQTSSGQPLAFTNSVHDGRGPSDNGTQSTIYGLSPTMHVCPRNFAMQGIQQAQNDLFCVS